MNTRRSSVAQVCRLSVTASRCAAIGHATWQRRRIERDGFVFLEVGGSIHHCHAALMRLVHLGTPPPLVRETERVVQEAMQATIEAIRRGSRPPRRMLGIGRSKARQASVGPAGGRDARRMLPVSDSVMNRAAAPDDA